VRDVPSSGAPPAGRSAPAPIAAPVAPTPPPPVVAAPPVVIADLEPLPPPAYDLWDRIRKGLAMPDIDDPLVAKWEQWYVARPDYVARMIDRSRRYLYYIVVEVEKRGMPLEVALLPMVESAFNPNAVSVARASGIWQFMPATGTHYGLKQNFWFDSGGTSSPRPAARSTTCRSFTATSTTGSSRWPAITGAKAT
jgi:membrane-bound lytic murein transglycosylase D